MKARAPIIPEFPSQMTAITLAVLMIIVLYAVVIAKKKAPGKIYSEGFGW